MYPVVYFDAIRIKIRNYANLVVPKAMHIALGVRPDGIKEILGMWIDEYMVSSPIARDKSCFLGTSIPEGAPPKTRALREGRTLKVTFNPYK